MAQVASTVSRSASGECLDRSLLQLAELGDPALGEAEEPVELCARNAALFAGGLHLDDLACAGQHEVGVGLCA